MGVLYRGHLSDPIAATTFLRLDGLRRALNSGAIEAARFVEYEGRESTRELKDVWS